MYVCMYVCVCMCFSMSLSLCLSVSVSVSLSLSLSLSVRLSLSLSLLAPPPSRATSRRDVEWRSIIDRIGIVIGGDAYNIGCCCGVIRGWLVYW